MDNIGNNIRLVLWVTFLALAWLTYTTWTNEHAVAPSAPATDGGSGAPESLGDDPLPPLDAPAGAGQGQTTNDATRAAAPAGSNVIRVRTDVLDVLIDLSGGDLVRADLPEYPVDKHDPGNVVRLLDYAPADRWVFQTGIQGVAGVAAPDHRATFRSASADYVLAGGQDTLVVTLDWAGEGPLAAQKVYTFRRGQYAIDLALKASAAAGTTWRAAPYAQMTRLYKPVERSYTSVDSYSFWGPVLFVGSQYEKLDFEDLAATPLTQTVKGAWYAAIQHHFLAAAVPPAEDDVFYRASTAGPDFVLLARGSPQSIDASAPLDYVFKLFVGPKLQDQLAATGPKLERAVDYGMLTVLAQPLFWLLSKVDSFVGNWGWAIIIVTIMIKLVFYKLTAMSGRSMAKMRRLAPRMKALQERYKEDRQALSTAMMELYKKEKVNPAAGCLPMLIQMPFFFAFYWVLVESVEMRQAPFMLWIDDLSARDPFFVLPLLMGVAMFFQTRMSPAPPDPMQARVMQIMPIVFTGFFLLFPAGLVLYWLTNTALSILQQWRINKIVASEHAAT
jgi:YidC/Oxa1 family membrane protein insertase